MTGLTLENLSVTFCLPRGEVPAMEGVTTVFPAGEITGLIGESGCGKSVLGLAVLGLLPPYARVEGKITLEEIGRAHV